MGAVPPNRPVVSDTSYWRRWLRLAVVLGWLLLAVTIGFAPKPRGLADELPRWKLVVWLILLFILFPVMVFVWKSG